MTFAEYANFSVAPHRVLVEIDISQFNNQWVNIGAGVWKFNVKALYPEVDESLLEGFFAVLTNGVKSVRVSTALQNEVLTLLEVSSNKSVWYWDTTTKDLYVQLINSDEPYLHEIVLGLIRGYSFDPFTPVGTSEFYEGRLISVSNINRKRDPLYFGKLSYQSASISLNNADGFFDMLGEDSTIYGSTSRIYLGFTPLDFNDYILVYSGYITNLNIDKEIVNFSIADRRRQLSKPYELTCTAQNALSAVSTMLESAYGLAYNSANYDLTAWNAATVLVDTITINMDKPEPVSNIIQSVCASVFGFFDVNENNLFTFKLIDTSAASILTIPYTDILNDPEINYDPEEVLSSLRVGYDVDLSRSATKDKTWLINTDYEASVFSTYLTYKQKDFESWLTTATAATNLSTTIMEYVKDVHGLISIETSIAYYSLNVGDMIDVEIRRENGTGMLGTKKCEILGKTYSLSLPPTITFDLRM